MASTGLGKGLSTLLAESAQQPVRALSEPDRYKNGSPAAEPVRPVTLPPSAKVGPVPTADKMGINRPVLLVADLLLLVIGAWLITASPMAHTTAAVVVGVALLVIGCALACIAVLPQGASK